MPKNIITTAEYLDQSAFIPIFKGRESYAAVPNITSCTLAPVTTDTDTEKRSTKIIATVAITARFIV